MPAMPVGSRPPPGHPSALNGLPFEEYDPSFPNSPSHSPDSELWADEDDLLLLPEFDAEVERTADPLFPSPHKFNLMMQDYLRNLSPKKREKALLTQKMYDAVLSVLQDPKDTSTKTAQFRFWAKKMFQLTSFGGEKVVCHDHKPVAVKEQIYEVLCHCHGQAGHGGRDKTSAQVRRYYSWIPKEIIARFVRDCPFCQSRRTQSTAGLSSMSESQAFLISLQSCDTQSASKRSVSLAQARANAAALGHKPYRRPSIRTIDASMCRSRRGSAVSEDEYVRYNDGPMSMSMSMATSMSGGGGGGTNGHRGYEMSLNVPGLSIPNDGYSFDPSQQASGQSELGYQPYPSIPIAMPRRASSYHESSLLGVRPTEAMYRRNSESDITFGLSTTTSAHTIYAEPDSTSNMGQFLSVPGMSGSVSSMAMGMSTGLQRSASASSLPALNDDTLAHFRQYAEQLRIDTSSSSASAPEVKIDSMSISMHDYRDPSSSSSTMSALPSEAVTPIDGHFPMSVHLGQIDMSSYFPTSYDMSATIDDSYLSHSSYQFPAPTASAGQEADQTQLWNSEFTFSSIPTASAAVTEEDAATAEAVAMVQRMFDSNNIFALGESAGVSTDQVVDMHAIDPALLDELQNQMKELDTTSVNTIGGNSLGLTGGDSELPSNAEIGGGAQIIVTRPSMTMFDMAALNLMGPSATLYTEESSQSVQQPIEYTVDDQFRDLHLAFSQNQISCHSQGMDDNALNPLLQAVVDGDLDMFGFTPSADSVNTTNLMAIGANPSSSLIDGTTIAQQEIDFSNWAGFVVS